MSDGPSTRRLVLWVGFVAFCTLAMAYLPFADMALPVIGHVTYYQVLLLGAALAGALPLLRMAGSPERSRSRTVSRIIVAYLLFEVLIVIPVAISLGGAGVSLILDTAAIRFTWLLFPVVVAICADRTARKRAGAVVAVAAGALALWGVYLAATGGGGYYLDSGELRFRILYGGATLLFAWPFALAASGAVSRKLTIALLGVSLVGLTLTNHRSGLIAFAITGVLCVVMSGQVRRLVPWIVPAALIAAVAGLLWGQQANSIFGYTLTHLFDVVSGNGADRLMRWRLAWEFFTTHPINDYVWSWRYYLVHLQEGYQPHNFALEIAVTEGVAGLAFYASVLGVAFRDAWKWGRKDAEARALIGYLVAYLVFVFANASWYLPVNFALMVGGVAALVARIDHLRKDERGCASRGQVSSE